VANANELSALQAKAKSGNVAAQDNLGIMYARGDGVAQDQKQAVHWYSKAAKQGDADAQYNLGIMYARGEGVALDNKRALFWFKKSAVQGHVGAQGVLDAVP